MFKKIDKVLAAFGNIKAMERLHVDDFTENIITNIEGTKIAESKYGQVIAEVEELNGYTFLEVAILSHTNIKTMKGASLVFTTLNDSFTIQSDTQEIESDFSNVSNRYMTQISFNVTPEDIVRINEKDFEEVQLAYKKRAIPFKKIN
ncbi:hypothetical protein [Dokdonia sp.]|uniref:hypothetical protein n=1 Tax=Dokdonia sp. TaxID=2024995 RepID=UPI00326317D6